MRLTFATMPTSGSASHSGSGTEQVCTRAVPFPLIGTNPTNALERTPSHTRAHSLLRTRRAHSHMRARRHCDTCASDRRLPHTLL
jgi:hypothetical protein